MANSVFSKSAQVRRGLSKGLEFFTTQELARQAAERETQQAVAKTQAQRTADVDKQRFQTALDLAKLGNLGAQGALQSYVQHGEPGALAGIGEFDEGAARNYQLAKEFGLPLTKEEQFGPANELLRRLGIRTAVGTTPEQKSRIGAFDALTSLREMQAKNDAALTANKILHLKALAKAADAKTREIQQRVSKGKMTDADIGDHLNELLDVDSILENQFKELSEAPDFYDEIGNVDKKYIPALEELNSARDRVRGMVDTYSNFMAQRAQQFQTARPLAPGQIPSRNVPPYPGDFVRQLMGLRTGAGAPQMSVAPPIAPAQPMPQTPNVPQTPPTVMTVPQLTPQVIQTPDGARWRVNADGSYTQVP